MSADFMDADDMCPNCVTPWKCNGPHLSPWQNSTDSGTEMAFRIAAFGAIRRAAEVARYDCKVRETMSWTYQTNRWTRTRTTPEADAIRRAIRAAIGSDKT